MVTGGGRSYRRWRAGKTAAANRFFRETRFVSYNPTVGRHEIPNRRGPALLFALTVFGQGYRGRVQGVVTDSSGAIIPAATLALKNTGTGVEVTRTANDQA